MSSRQSFQPTWNKIILFLFCALFAVIPSLIVSPLIMAGELQLDATVVGQARENDGSQREIPVNGYLGANLDVPSSHLSTAGDLRIFPDFNPPFYPF